MSDTQDTHIDDLPSQPMPPEGATPQDMICFYAENYGVDPTEVVAQIQDLNEASIPNNQRRKEMYHLMAVWAGVVSIFMLMSSL